MRTSRILRWESLPTSRLKSKLASPLASASEISEIAARLRTIPGIFALRGDEYAVTVVYDPAQITAPGIRAAFVQLGYDVKAGTTEIVDPGVAAD